MGAGEVQGVCEFAAELGRRLVSFFFRLEVFVFAEDSCVVVIIIFTPPLLLTTITTLIKRLLASFVSNPGGCFCECFVAFSFFLCFAFFSFLF